MSLCVSIKKAFQGFRLEVEFDTATSTMGILGASGCGKTMTLKCIAGIETPDAGRIAVDGRVLFDSAAKINLRPQQRRVGYLFQDYALFPNMTTAQNIGCALKLPKEEKRQRVEGLVRRFQLEGLENRFPHQLSGGQQQRAALSRMLATEPEIVLLDEPFSALDAHLREQLQLQLAQVLANQSNAIMVTHSRDEAYKLCGGLLVMENGRAVALGDTKSMFRDPRAVQVARLTGCKNISRAQRCGEYRVRALDWGLELRTARPVGEDVTYVGVRAHDFHPVYSPSAPQDNLIPVEVTGQSEDPFEWNILFQNAQGGSPLWWKYPKPEKELPSHLLLPPEALLLLTGTDTASK